MGRDVPTMPEGSEEYFDCLNVITYETSVTFTPESWHGRMTACRGIGASSLPKEKLSEWSREHTEYVNTLPDSFDVPHWVSMMDFKVKT